MRNCARLGALLLATMACACERHAAFAERTVLILVEDGVRLEDSFAGEASTALEDDNATVSARTLKELVPRGSVFSNAWNGGYTVTAPAHAEMLTGRRLPFANYEPNGFPGLYRPELPSVFEALRAQKGAARKQLGLVANTNLLQALGHSVFPGAGYGRGADWVFVQDPATGAPSGHDAEVLEVVLERLRKERGVMILANLHQVDRSAHYGSEEAYPRDLAGFDESLPDFYDEIQAMGLGPSTWIFVLADHGRHDISEDDPVWRNHGCDCEGCRRVPLLVLGPDVENGGVHDDPDDIVLLADIGRTAAHLLDVELPWSDGFVLEGMPGASPEPSTASGLAGIALAGGHRAEVRYLEDRAHRTAIYFDDEPVSSPGAVQAEAPALAVDGERVALCFRELELLPDTPHSPWRARCMLSEDGGAAWSEADPASVNVGPYWEPVLFFEPDGGLLGVWPWNPNGSVGGGADDAVGEVSLRLARLMDGQWSFVDTGDIGTFPVDASAVIFGADEAREIIVAFGAGLHGLGARATRDVVLLHGTPSTLRPLGVAHRAGLQGLAPEEPEWRLEHPSLSQGDDVLRLAAVGFIDKRVLPVLASSADRGETWRESWIPELPGEPFPHLAPLWTREGDSVWSVLDPLGEVASLCRLPFGREASPVCEVLPGPRVLDMALSENEIVVLVDMGVGAWEPVTVPLEGSLGAAR